MYQLYNYCNRPSVRSVSREQKDMKIFVERNENSLASRCTGSSDSLNFLRLAQNFIRQSSM